MQGSDQPHQPNPDSVSTVADLVKLLQQIRLLRIDRLSYAKMADCINNEISKSKMSRIFKGADFPSRAHLHLILDILNIDRANRDSWDTMWERLAQDWYSSKGWQEGRLDLPTNISDRGDPGRGNVPPSMNIAAMGNAREETEKRQAAIIADAMDEAQRIVKSARAAAEDERDALIQEARTAASNIIDKLVVEQTRVIRENEVKIAEIVGEAEEKLKMVVVALNESADNTQRTSEEFRQILDHVRTSVMEVRGELAQVKEEAAIIREKYSAESASKKDSKEEGKRGRRRLITDKWFSDTRKVPPATIDAQTHGDDGDNDNEPPWLRNG